MVQRQKLWRRYKNIKNRYKVKLRKRYAKCAIFTNTIIRKRAKNSLEQKLARINKAYRQGGFFGREEVQELVGAIRSYG